MGGISPSQGTSQPSVFSAQQHHILELEIQTILEKEVIKESGTGPGEFIFFLRSRVIDLFE